jgi:hypothetical protein
VNAFGGIRTANAYGVGAIPMGGSFGIGLAELGGDVFYGKAFWETGKLLRSGGIALATNPYVVVPVFTIGGVYGIYTASKIQAEYTGKYIDNAKSIKELEIYRDSLFMNLDDPFSATAYMLADQKIKELGNNIGNGNEPISIFDITRHKEIGIKPYTDIDSNVTWNFNDPSFKPSLLIGTNLFEKQFGPDILYKKSNDDKLKQKQKVKTGAVSGAPNPNDYDPDNEEWKEKQKDARKFKLDPNKENESKILENLDKSAQDFISKRGSLQEGTDFLASYV